MSPCLNIYTHTHTHTQLHTPEGPSLGPLPSSMSESTLPVYKPKANTHHEPLIAPTALRALLLPNTGQHPKESPVSRGNVLPYVQCGQQSGLVSPHRGQHQTLPPFCPTASLADCPAKEQNKLMASRQMCSGCDVGHNDGGERCAKL